MTFKGKGIIIGKYKGNALFYQLQDKVSLGNILSVSLGKPELSEEVPSHYESETHWLADWDFKTENLFNSINETNEVEVEFEIKSTAYIKDMRHDHKSIGSCRNLNAIKIEPVK